MAQENKDGEFLGVLPVRVVISGAAGQIGYSLLPLFASGQVFGLNQPVILHLLEIEQVLPSLKGVVMELEDGAYPLVHGIVLTSKTEEAFKDVDYAILVGGFPRKQGMERKDLMDKNAPIFKSMGEALEKYAKETCKVLVVANPANTNCLVCSHYAPKLPKQNFSALTRLDMNRAQSQVGIKLGVNVGNVKNIIIWGNHSSTQVPDIDHGIILQQDAYRPVRDLLDEKWIRGDFTKLIQQRGKTIIDIRGVSSAMSAANAIKDCLKDWLHGTNKGEHVSMAVYSDGSYGVPKGIFYSFPCVCKNGQYNILQGLKISTDVAKLMKISADELLEEKKEAGLN